MFQTKAVEKIKAHTHTHTHKHVIFSNFFFVNRTVYEIMCKNVIEPSRPQMTIRRVCIACWVPKATNTHSGRAILIAFPLQQLLHERAPLLSYTHVACLGIS